MIKLAAAYAALFVFLLCFISLAVGTGFWLAWQYAFAAALQMPTIPYLTMVKGEALALLPVLPLLMMKQTKGD